MTLPINSLANMEYMLYGGALGANPNCPSYANGYKAVNNNYYNPYMQQYQNGTSYVPSSIQPLMCRGRKSLARIL